MAASEKQSNRTHSVISKLTALGCPYLQGMEESVVVRIVLTKGEARARVLCWLLDRFLLDLPLNHLSTCVSMDTATLTSHFASIGLCKKDNIALIEGKTSLLQQLLFLESLIQMVETASSKERSVSPLVLCVPQLEGSCRFTDTICASERLDSSVFAHSLNLLPPDIGHHLDSRVVSMEELSSEAGRLSSLLQDRQCELHSILQQHQYEEVNTAVMQSCVKTLAVSLQTLTQLVTNFCQSYEAELQPWVGHRQPPTLGPLGPLCKRTATHWNHISKILSSLQQLETTLQGLQSMPAMDIYPACHKAQETLQQCINLVVPVVSPR